MSGNKRRRKAHAEHEPTIKASMWIWGAALVAVLLGGFFSFWTLSSDGESVPENFIPQVLGAPRVAVAEEVLDYGDVKMETPIKSIFEVQNVGDKPLIIYGEPMVELVEGC